MKIIDLTCKGCGQSMEFDEPEVKFTTEFNKATNTIIFYTEDDRRLKLECPYCHTKQLGWLAGDETSRVNGLNMNVNIKGNGNQVVGIHIGGNVVGSNITIGNNKVT